MNEIDVLHDVFGPDEVPSVAAHDRARSALADRINGPGPRRRPRWSLRIATAVATAAAVALGVVFVMTDDAPPDPRQATGPRGGASSAPAAPPYARPAGATEFLENVAWAAARKPWVTPRTDQFMYIETISTVNNRQVSDAAPNGPLVPGKTESQRRETWMRIDGQVMGGRDNGGPIRTAEQNARQMWVVIPYGDISVLDTPEKYEAWRNAPKMADANPEALLMQNVLPPAVEAAIFRWLARQPDVQVDQNSVNLDGRPAIALTFHLEGYLKHDLLFDPQTYALIGDRLVAVADHVNEALDGTTRIKAGDVFRLEVRGRSGIVDTIGETA
jgi:hypothetical protein